MDRDFYGKCKIISTSPLNSNTSPILDAAAQNPSSKLSSTTTGLFNLVTGRNNGTAAGNATNTEWQNLLVCSSRLSVVIEDCSFGSGSLMAATDSINGVRLAALWHKFLFLTV